MRAGSYTTDITPNRELPNYYNSIYRPSVSKFELACSAIYFGSVEDEGVILSCDLTFMDRPLVLRIRDECSRLTGIPFENITVAATHNHTAPAACPSFLSGALPDPLYLDFLVERATEAVQRAKQSARPARLVAVIVEATGAEMNRRFMKPQGGISFQKQEEGCMPEGPTDPDMQFIGFEDMVSSKCIGLVVNYSCHNLGCRKGGSYHKDVFGTIRDHLQTKMPTDTVVMLPAPCGNIALNCKTIGMTPEGRNSQPLTAEQVAAKAAQLVATGYREAKRKETVNLRFAKNVLTLRDRKIADSTFCYDGCRGTTPEAREFARRRYDPEKAAVTERGNTTCPVEIQVIAFGPAAVVTNPAELFVEYELAIKDRSPFDVTLVSELTNGYCGYVPTQKAFRNDGYECHRTVYTSRLQKDAGEIIAEVSLNLLSECS